MAKRENEGQKEKKQKKERKIKRKQDGGLLLNPISVPRARTRACEGRRIACTCTFAEAGEAAMEIIDNCFGSLERDFRIWAWYCRHFDRNRIVDRAYFYASCQKCNEILSLPFALAPTVQRAACALPFEGSVPSRINRYHPINQNIYLFFLIYLILLKGVSLDFPMWPRMMRIRFGIILIQTAFR